MRLNALDSIGRRLNALDGARRCWKTLEGAREFERQASALASRAYVIDASHSLTPHRPGSAAALESFRCLARSSVLKTCDLRYYSTIRAYDLPTQGAISVEADSNSERDRGAWDDTQADRAG